VPASVNCWAPNNVSPDSVTEPRYLLTYPSVISVLRLMTLVFPLNAFLASVVNLMLSPIASPPREAPIEKGPADE
jgi:hypothetical protein